LIHVKERAGVARYSQEEKEVKVIKEVVENG